MLHEPCPSRPWLIFDVRRKNRMHNQSAATYTSAHRGPVKKRHIGLSTVLAIVVFTLATTVAWANWGVDPLKEWTQIVGVYLVFGSLILIVVSGLTVAVIAAVRQRPTRLPDEEKSSFRIEARESTK